MDSITTFTTERYEALRAKAVACLRQGRLGAAEAYYREALGVAREIGDADLADRAYCNLVAVRIGRHEDPEALPRLRQILTRNGDAGNCSLAAYNLARAYEHRRDYKKGLFYARIALERFKSLQRDDSEWLAMALNQLGNLLVAESFFHEAIGHYREALGLEPSPPLTLRAMISQNIGYCLVMTDRPTEGLSLIFKSRHVLRRNPQMVPQLHLDIALAHLELGRYRDARRHGEKALRAAKREGRAEEIKNALFVVGEAANLEGDEDLARHYFDLLQEYFPGTPFVSDFLLATDVRQLVNLRA